MTQHGRQVWILLVMALALMLLVAAILTGRVPKRAATSSDRPGEEDAPRAMVTTPAAVRAPGEATAEPSSTVTTVVPSGSAPTSTALPREDHYWIERPIRRQGHGYVEGSYRYASRGDGTLPVHYGVELAGPHGTPIEAGVRGTVVVAGDDQRKVYGRHAGYYGQLVIVQLEKTLEGQSVFVLYGHLDEVSVVVGQRVEPGDVVGLVGASGVAEGPHLHLEVRYGVNGFSATVNPELWLVPEEGCGTLAARIALPNGEELAEARIVLYRAERPDAPVLEAGTYALAGSNPDPTWGENLAIGRLKAGRWLARLSYRNRTYIEQFTIMPGATTWIEMQVGR